MNAISLLFIICLATGICLWVENQVTWLSHITGLCLALLSAVFLSSLGIIPHEHALYDFFMGPIALIAIAQMAFSLRLEQFFKLPKKLLLIFFVGTASSIAGGVITALVSSRELGINGAKIAAQLTASFIGGNENAVAVAKLVGVPNEIFISAFSIDSMITGLWMVVTIATIALDPDQKRKIEPKNDEDPSDLSLSLSPVSSTLSLAFAILAALISQFLGGYFTGIHTVIYVTSIAILISQIKPLRKHLRASYSMGSFLFIPFFFSSGATASPRRILEAPISLVIMPLSILLIHGAVTYGVGYFLRIPLSYTSIASQTLIGGADTAIATARAKHWKEGVYLGLILGLAGYGIANFCGLLVYFISVQLLHLIGTI